MDNQKFQSVHWSSEVPYRVWKQISNCTSKGRHITGLAFRNDWWYVSGEKPDGSGGYCWGNLPEKSCNAKVAIGAYEDYYDKHSYLVCHEHGGYSSSQLPLVLSDIMDEAETIHSIFLGANNDFFIRYDLSMNWSLSNHPYLYRELKSTKKGIVLSVAIFEDNSWVVFRHNSFTQSTGIPDTLGSLIQKHYEDQKNQVDTQKRRIASYQKAIVLLQ